MAQGRNVFKEAFRNFIKSLTPKNYWGELRGKDIHGTEYYEGPVNHHTRRSRRWFSAIDGAETPEVPPEWDAWLKHKRKKPPTEEEIEFNRLKMLNTIENAKELQRQRNETDDITNTISNQSSFPTYKEYSSNPETFQVKKKD